MAVTGDEWDEMSGAKMKENSGSMRQVICNPLGRINETKRSSPENEYNILGTDANSWS
jgi:hypothetical protein